MLKIKEIKARAFRGIGELFTLKLDGKSLVLYGDNGTGKSSIVETIEYALTGHVHSIEKRGQRITFARHGAHVTMTRTDTMVEVCLSDGNSDYPISFPAGRLSTETSVAAFLSGCQSGTFILRRSKLLEFIETVDKDRYLALRAFLGLEKYERLEGAIKAGREDQERRATQAKTTLSESQKQIITRLGLPPGTPFSDAKVFESLNSKLRSIKYPDVSSSEDLRKAIDFIKERLTAFGDTSAQVKLAECQSRINEYVAVVPTAETVKAVYEQKEQVAKLEAQLTGVFYEEVLKKGSQWISEENASTCPLCEREITDRDALLKRIQARLDEHAELLKARSLLRNAVVALRTRVQSCAEAYKKAMKKWEEAKLDRSAWPLDPLQGIVLRLTAALGLTDRIEDSGAFQTAANEIGDANIDASLRQIAQIIRSRQDAFPKSEDVELLVELQTQCVYCLEELPNLANLGREADKTGSSSQLTIKLHEFAVQARKQACREVFSEISKDIGEIYGKFHPNEGLGDFELEVREVGEGSAALKGRFPGRPETEDPRGLYSEAHLDTLGLAVFLALRKREERLNPGFKIVVLDDILTSVDAPHRIRVATYLLSEFSQEHQMIITTHSRPWYEWIVQLQTTHGFRERFVNKRILDWSLGKGPQIVDMEGDFEYLQNHKGTSAHEHTAPIAGRLLENVLQELRYSLRLAVGARRDERYTIGDLWPKFMSTCKKKYKHLWTEVQPICDSLNDTVVLRNWETHSNDWAKEISRQEAMEFIDGAMTLYQKVFCSQCSTFVEFCERPQGSASCKKGCLFYPGGIQSAETTESGYQ